MDGLELDILHLPNLPYSPPIFPFLPTLTYLPIIHRLTWFFGVAVSSLNRRFWSCRMSPPSLMHLEAH